MNSVVHSWTYKQLMFVFECNIRHTNVTQFKSLQIRVCYKGNKNSRFS